MNEDFESQSFNSYNEGPGYFVNKSKISNSGYTLFVDHIPVSLKQVYS